MLSLKHNFLFIHIPKTGGNSIQKILEQFSEDKIVKLYGFQDGEKRFSIKNPVFPYHKHSTLREYKKLLPNEKYTPLLKFTVVRNPWERMVSLYFSPHAGRTKFNLKVFETVIQKAQTLEHFVDSRSWVEKIMGKNILKSSEINRFIRFENLEQEFKVLCSELGLGNLPLAKLNASNKKDYQEYYTHHLKKIVANKFKNEIEFFKYRFEGDSASLKSSGH